MLGRESRSGRPTLRRRRGPWSAFDAASHDRHRVQREHPRHQHSHHHAGSPSENPVAASNQRRWHGDIPPTTNDDTHAQCAVEFSKDTSCQGSHGELMLYRSPAIHRSTFASSTGSGTAPVSRIASWNRRTSNLSPRAFSALARSSRILSWPILYAQAWPGMLM